MVGVHTGVDRHREEREGTTTEIMKDKGRSLGGTSATDASEDSTLPTSVLLPP